MTKVGMNQGGLLYWNDDEAFIDHMKMAGDWDEPANILAMDENGWPTKISGPVTTYVPMTGEIKPYIIRWEGKGTFKLSRFYKPREKGENHLIVDTASLPNADSEVPSNGFTILTIDATDPIRNISIVELANDAAHQAGALFDPEYVEQMRGYAQLRFMDWMRTNEHLPDTKAAPNFPSINARSYFWGAPLSVCLKLCEETGARPWVNIPLLATDDEIRAFGRTCPPDADIEWSNELWNVGFAQGKWVAEHAKAANTDKNLFIAQQQMRVAKILESVGRKLVVGRQPSDNEKLWKAYGDALIAAGATSKNVSRVMTTAYVTGGLNWQLQAPVQPLRAFMERGDKAAVHVAMLKEAREVSGLRFKTAKDLADRLGTPWSVYEANAHLNMDHGVKDEFTPFVAEVQRDPGIRPVFEALLQAAEDYGCDVFNAFAWSGQPSMKGFFGVKGTPFGSLLDERRLAAPESEPLTLESIDRRLRAVEARLA